MPATQEKYDDAMFAFTTGDFDTAIRGFEAILERDPDHFDARLAVGMAWCRKGDFARAIEEGHRAEKLRPQEQLVHTNLSLFYLKVGDKTRAEHHGLQARIAGWRGNMDAPKPADTRDPDLAMASERPVPAEPPVKFPEMPWKKKAGPGGSS